MKGVEGEIEARAPVFAQRGLTNDSDWSECQYWKAAKDFGPERRELTRLSSTSLP